MLNQWHGRVVWFPLGFIMWATVLWLFGSLASLDGPHVTNSLFSQTCLSTISSVRCLSRRFLLAWRGRIRYTHHYGGAWWREVERIWVACRGYAEGTGGKSCSGNCRAVYIKVRGRTSLHLCFSKYPLSLVYPNMARTYLCCLTLPSRGDAAVKPAQI